VLARHRAVVVTHVTTLLLLLLRGIVVYEEARWRIGTERGYLAGLVCDKRTVWSYLDGVDSNGQLDVLIVLWELALRVVR
jgi:hypothetical protein